MKGFFAFWGMAGEFLLSHELRCWLRPLAKPGAVAVGVTFLLLLVGQFDVRVAAAQAAPLACPAGTEQNGALCYPLCDAGFYGDGPVCWKQCPDGFRNDSNIFCIKEAHIFAKASYGRGGGAPLVCAANQQAQSGLCYPKCATGYYGVGPVCWQFCRPGYADHGASCFKNIFDWHFKHTYGRGAGAAVSACPAGTERSGSLCYPRCAAGFVGAGPVCWQSCPAGYKDDGAFCRKDAVVIANTSYGRGAGTVMNSVPVALDEIVRTAKDTPVELVFPVNNDDSDPLSDVIFVQDPSHGDTSNNVYTPNAGYEGADIILWKINDGKHDSNVAIATILVGDLDPNNAPVALDRVVAVFEETPITIDVLCADADGDDLFYQLLAKPQHGAYTWQPPNTVIYTPSVDFVGTDFFTFRSHDGQDASNVSTITLTVTAVNDAPVALAQVITTTRNVNGGIVLQASDAEGDSITYTLVTSPTHGQLSGAGADWVYTPGANFTGEDGFRFQASDGQGATTAPITVTVQPSNTAPVAVNLVFTTGEASAVTIDLLAGDADGDPLTYTLVTTPVHGLLDGAGAAWTYTPNAGFSGQDSFQFLAEDGATASAPAAVAIEVTPAPDEGILAGFVYEDRNGNGQPDAEDAGVGNLPVTVTPVARTGVVAFTAVTDAIGAWRIESVPFGQYTVRVESTASVQLAAPVSTQVTVAQRGLQLAEAAGVTLSGRALFLPVVVR